MKYFSGLYKRHWTKVYVEIYVELYFSRQVIAIGYVGFIGFNLTFDVHKKPGYFYSPKSLYRHHGVSI